MCARQVEAGVSELIFGIRESGNNIADVKQRSPSIPGVDRVRERSVVSRKGEHDEQVADTFFNYVNLYLIIYVQEEKRTQNSH